jgi:hypothetical protein
MHAYNPVSANPFFLVFLRLRVSVGGWGGCIWAAPPLFSTTLCHTPTRLFPSPFFAAEMKLEDRAVADVAPEEGGAPVKNEEVPARGEGGSTSSPCLPYFKPH